MHSRSYVVFKSQEVFVRKHLHTPKNKYEDTLMAVPVQELNRYIYFAMLLTERLKLNLSQETHPELEV